MPTAPNGSLSIDRQDHLQRLHQWRRSPAPRRAAAAAIVCAWGLASGGAVTFAEPQETRSSVDSLKKLSVAELMNVQVTSVSRTEESRQSVAAAVTVVTNEEIRRSGATTIPEALRLVPGLHVARESASQWAISARGFSSVNSEKLLVIEDTRSIYTPLVSGVFWDVQDYLLEDIDRIEVIRGPGATQWGANAVNGVISVTTKSARDTQGLFAELNSGSEERVSAGVRYGGKAGSRGHYRLFGKYYDRDESFHTNPFRSDDWNAGRFGGRADWELTTEDTFTLQGSLYNGSAGQLRPSVVIEGVFDPSDVLNADVAGGNVLAHWRRATVDTGDVQVRFYYDRTHRDDPHFVDDLHTMDVDFQNRIDVSRQEVTWGLTYRLMSNENAGKHIFALDPSGSTDHLYSGFIQDQITIGDSVRLTLGTKVEHNDFSGVEVQPSGRIAWDFAATQMAWGSVSRAVRVPTRVERDVRTFAGVQDGVEIWLLGNSSFESERLIAYEAGYRWQGAESFSLDLAGFHNRYAGLAAFVPGALFPDPASAATIQPIYFGNENSGHSQGAEAVVTYAPIQASRFTANYSWLDMDIDPGPLDVTNRWLYERATPRHQVGLRSSLDLPASLQLDVLFRSLGPVRESPDFAGDRVPRYSELDVRVGWGGWRQLELAVVGQNLLHDHHAEFGASASRAEIQRAVYARVAWGF